MLEKLHDLLNSKGYIMDYGPNYIEIKFSETTVLMYVSDVLNSYQIIIFGKSDGLEISRASYKRPSYLLKYMIKHAN